MKIYSPDYFPNFNLGNKFDKYVMAEVENFEDIKDRMEVFRLP